MQYFWPLLIYAVVATTPSNLPEGMCIGIPFSNDAPVAPILADLGSSCWYDWHFGSHSDGYVPMLFSSGASGSELQIMRRQPERLWFVLNEPERPGQADMEPGEAIAVTQQVDATGASWACCGTIAWDSEWLDAYLHGGGLVPDYWHIHIYGAQDASGWDAYLDDFYRWMDSRDVARPVIVSETNAFGAGTDEQCELLEHVAERVEDDERLLAVFWFSTRYGNGIEASLYDEFGNLTKIGETFKGLQ